MANRQYIGARYVPKFYQNSVDGSTQWEANVGYDPLIYVTLTNGHMYISKKQVPATVGSPASNIDYWLDIGSYNGMIQQLQNQIDALVADVNAAATTANSAATAAANAGTAAANAGTAAANAATAAANAATVADDAKNATVTFRPYFRPEDYGAVIDDPTVDCSLAIKQAILAANAAKGGKVLLSPGIYYCTTPIRISEHLYCVDIIGAGSTYNSDTSFVKGSSINYSGSGTFLHFANGTWKCNFKDFAIWSNAHGATLRFSCDDDTNNIARATNNTMDNVCVSFDHHGLELTNAAYFFINRCVFKRVTIADESANTDINPIGVLLETNNEYVTMRDCTIVPNQINSFTGSNSWSRGLKINNVRHFTISNLDITDCDEAIYIEPPTSDDNCDFIFADSIDVARVHIGICARANVAPINNVVVEQLIFTAEPSLHANNRVVKIEKTSGASAYAFRGKIHNIGIRTGANEMTYWVKADAWSLAPGLCDFTFCTSQMPKVSYGDQRAANNVGFSTMTYDAAKTVDLDDYKYAGVLPFLAAAGSTNGVGHPAMIVNFANNQATIQIALPTSPSYPIMYRIYQDSNSTWGAWKTLSQT